MCPAAVAIVSGTMTPMTNKPERWTASHFSMGNPAGPGQDDVPRLLRRVADALEGYGKVEVHDLVLHNEVTADGDWPSVTVYFTDTQPD